MILACEPACLELPSTWSNDHKDVFDVVCEWVDLLMLGNTEREVWEIMRWSPVALCLVTQWLHCGRDCDVWTGGGADGRSTAGNCSSRCSHSLIISAQCVFAHPKCKHTHSQRQKRQQSHNASSTHRINARQLHADVDDHDGDDLPADTAVHEQAPDRNGLDGGQRALLLLHLLNLCLDISFCTVPL